MILKNIFGKTIEAAKKSAQQMYGDDFLVIETAEAIGNGKAKVTIFSDGEKTPKSLGNTPSNGTSSGKKQDKKKNSKQRSASSSSQKTQKPGVKFERSSKKEQSAPSAPSSAPAASATPKKSSSKLNSLRKFAEELEKKEFAEHYEEYKNGVNGTAYSKNGSTHQNGTAFTAKEKSSGSVSESEDNSGSDKPDDGASKNKNGTTYSRSAIRTTNGKSLLNGTSENGKKNGKTKEKSLFKDALDNDAETDAIPGNKFITHFKKTQSDKPSVNPAARVAPPRNTEREINALHKRFDKLEALLDSSLISANLDYASHPAFQQLVHTGINTSVIAGWFSKIIEQGIDPYDQPEQFMNKLAATIRSALGTVSFEEPQKFMLFVGPSGSGKTSMIMKLSQHPELMHDKKVAVVSVHPQKKFNTPYYTILKPFCEDNDIPYFEIKKGKDVNDNLEELEQFDHVFIDTPSINVEQDNSFRDFWKIRQMLTPFTPLEVHYVVNASLNRFYFRNSSASHHPLQPDYVAITHLDEVSQWGPIIPFLEEMGCNAHYVSKGESVPNSLGEFNPQWFAQQILQEN